MSHEAIWKSFKLEKVKKYTELHKTQLSVSWWRDPSTPRSRPLSRDAEPLSDRLPGTWPVRTGSWWTFSGTGSTDDLLWLNPSENVGSCRLSIWKHDPDLLHADSEAGINVHIRLQGRGGVQSLAREVITVHADSFYLDRFLFFSQLAHAGVYLKGI